MSDHLLQSGTAGDWTGHGHIGGSEAQAAVVRFRTLLEQRWEAAERAVAGLQQVAGLGAEGLRAVRDLREARTAFDAGRIVTARRAVAALSGRLAALAGAERREPPLLVALHVGLGEPMAGAALFRADCDERERIAAFAADLRAAITTLPSTRPADEGAPATRALLRQHHLDLLSAATEIERQMTARAVRLPLRLLRQAGLLNAAVARAERLMSARPGS